MNDLTFNPAQMQIEPGYAVVVSAQGAAGPASAISYTCTIYMPDGIFQNIAGLVPNIDRYPDPIAVRPFKPGNVFPVYRVNGFYQMVMPRELPDFAPCGGQSPLRDPARDFVAAFAAMPESVKAAVAAELKRFL